MEILLIDTSHDIEHVSCDTHMLSPGITEELEEVSSRHQLHDDVYWIILKAQSQDLHYVLMIEVTMEWEWGLHKYNMGRGIDR